MALNYFASTISDLTLETTYYFRAKVCVNAEWIYGDEKSFTTTKGASTLCKIGAEVTGMRSGGCFTRMAISPKTGVRAYDMFSVIGLFKQSLARVGSIASYKPSLRLFRTALATARARATSFPMGPARKIFMKLATAKRFVLDLWVAADKCLHRWSE